MTFLVIENTLRDFSWNGNFDWSSPLLMSTSYEGSFNQIALYIANSATCHVTLHMLAEIWNGCFNNKYSNCTSSKPCIYRFLLVQAKRLSYTPVTACSPKSLPVSDLSTIIGLNFGFFCGFLRKHGCFRPNENRDFGWCKSPTFENGWIDLYSVFGYVNGIH